MSITCAIDVSQVASSLAFLRSFAPSCASFGEKARVGSTSEDTPSMSASAEPPLAMLTHDAFMMPGRTHRANAAIAAPSASSWLVLDTDRISETDDGSAIGGSAAVFTTRAARTFFAQQLSTWILEATTSPPARWTAPAPADRKSVV